jgi:ABC-type branched-subunit amino acid transport system ATPase component
MNSKSMLTGVETGSTTNDTDSRCGNTGNNANRGYFLRWSRLHKRVDVKDNTGGLMGGSSIAGSFTNGASAASTKKNVLHDCSGYAAPGEVLCCMGPSGAGKTSLMNVLSGRSSYQEGVISINGEPTTAHTMKRLMSKVAYVKQADIFFGHLTVRDQLTYTALLRMSSSIPTADKHTEVERVIRLLRLTKVGDSQIRNLSGGERKRVNIGTELLTDPTVLLLDEPTSGLVRTCVDNYRPVFAVCSSVPLERVWLLSITNLTHLSL